jgi:hypothetical protein
MLCRLPRQSRRSAGARALASDDDGDIGQHPVPARML